MNILKHKVSQMLLVGILFALIGGVCSIFVNKLLWQEDLEKQIVIIDVANKNPLFVGLSGLNINKQFGDKIVTISKELSNSINYTIIRHQKDLQQKGCSRIKMEFTDNSIFVETNNYLKANRKTMDACLDNLFFLSFERLKKKLDLNTSQEMTKINFVVDDLNERTERLRKESFERQSDASKISQSLVEQMCRQIEDVYNDVLTEVNLVSKDGLLQEKNLSDESRSKNLMSVFSLFQNIFAFNTLAKQCDVLDIIVINQEIEKLLKTESSLKKLKDIFMTAQFADVFKVEKLNIITRNHNRYMSKKNVLITFSFLGFVFGILLMYNFRFSK